MRGPRAIRRFVGALRGMAVLSTMAALIVPAAMAAEPKPAPQRYIPARGLIAYLEFDGLAAHAEAWEATAAYAMLARTPAGAMMGEIVRQIADRFFQLIPGARLKGADLVALQDHLVHRGFAIALHRHRDDVYSWTIVLNGAGRPGTRERFDRLLEPVLAPTPPEKMPAPVRMRDRSVYQVSEPVATTPGGIPLPSGAAPGNDPQGPAIPRLSWWFEKDDLVLTSVSFTGFESGQDASGRKRMAEIPANHFAAVIDALEGKQPDAATHPAYRAAVAEGGDIKGFESDGLFFIDSGRKGGLLGGFLESPGGLSVSGLVAGSVPRVNGPIFAPPPDHLEIQATPSARASGLPTAVTPPGTPDPPVGPAPVPAVVPTPTDGAGPAPAVVRPSPSSVVPAAGLPPVPFGPDPKAQPRNEPRDAEARKEEAELVRILGLEGIGRIVGRWGFQGKALLTDVRVEVPSPRKGLVGLLDQPAFAKDRLPPIPRSTASFVVDSFDPAAVYGRLTELARSVDPEAGALIDQLERATRDATGLRLREDLLGQVGPTWCVFPAPTADGGGGKGELDPASFVLVGGLRDADGFSKVLDALANRANQYLRDRERPEGQAAAGDGKADAPTIVLERLPAPHRGYRLTSPSRLVFWLNEEVQPTILVGRSAFAIAAHPDRARDALALEAAGGGGWRPTGELANSFACLPARLTFLSVGDPRASEVPALIAGLPGFVQLMCSGLAEAGDAASPDFLTLVGIPGAGQFRLRIDPDQVPKEEDLRSHLFPSVFASTVDDRGIRFIAREAIPLGCTGNGASLRSRMKWSQGKGFERDLLLGLKSAFGG